MSYGRTQLGYVLPWCTRTAKKRAQRRWAHLTRLAKLNARRSRRFCAHSTSDALCAQKSSHSTKLAPPSDHPANTEKLLYLLDTAANHFQQLDSASASSLMFHWLEPACPIQDASNARDAALGINRVCTAGRRCDERHWY